VGTVRLNGPALADGKCIMCLARAKQVQWEQYQDEIKAGYEAPGDKVTWIPWPAALDKEIADGPYRAVPGDAPQLGVVDGLCWNDVAGLAQPQPPQRLAVPPPGLIPGRR